MPPCPWRAQGRRDGLDDVQRAFDVDLHGQVELLVTDVQRRQAQDTVDAVQKPVNAPEFVLYLLGQGLRLPRRGHVGGDGQHPLGVELLPDLLRQGLNAKDPAAGHGHHGRPLLQCQSPRRRVPDAAGRARHDDDPPLQSPACVVHNILPLWLLLPGLSAEPCGLSRLFGYNRARRDDSSYRTRRTKNVGVCSKRLLNILLVEDDDLDVMNVRRAFKKNNIANPLYVAGGWRRGARHAARGSQVRPKCPPSGAIILLDLNMPRMNGIEFLRALRADPALQTHPCDRADHLRRGARQGRGVQPQRRRLHPQARHARQLRRDHGDSEQRLDAERTASSFDTFMSETLTVLVVDDDDLDRMAARRALRAGDPSVRVAEAKSCAEALAVLESEAPPDAVLLDYQLPDGDGLSVLRQVRARSLTTPIIMLTGYGDELVAVELMKAGAADYLAKGSLTPDNLWRSLRGALRLRQTEDALRNSEERFRLLMENVLDYAIFLTDPQGRVAEWSAGAQRILGYKAGGDRGARRRRHFHSRRSGAGGAPAGDDDGAAEGRADDERWHLRQDGRRFFASGVMTPLRDEAGEPARLLQDPAGRHRAQAGGGRAAFQRGALPFPGLRDGADRLDHLRLRGVRPGAAAVGRLHRPGVRRSTGAGGG